MITCHFVTIHRLSRVLSLLTSESKKNLLELKESQLLMIDRPSLNRKIRSSPLDMNGLKMGWSFLPETSQNKNIMKVDQSNKLEALLVLFPMKEFLW